MSIDKSIADDETQFWMLERGEYVVAIGLFRREQGGSSATVYRTESHIRVHSRNEARYYHNQFIDLKRRVKKLEKGYARLF